MEKLTETKRILAVFAKPRRAMEDIGQSPTVMVPVLCMIVFPILAMILNLDYARGLLVTTMQQTGMTGDLSSIIQIQLYSALALAPLSTLAGWFIFSLMIFFLCHLFGGDGELSFKQARSLAGYAYLVTVPFTILSSVLILVNPDYAISFSLYDALKSVLPAENLYLIAFCQLLTLYKVWESVIVAVGIKTIKDTGAAKAAGVVVVLFVLQYALQIVMAVMGQNALGQVA